MADEKTGLERLEASIDRLAAEHPVAQELSWWGVYASPVYGTWLRLNSSSHEAAFQETGYHEEFKHTEASVVTGALPWYQKFTSNVFGDFNKMALQGHDVGPLIPHICSAPNVNLLAPMNWLLSSCKWPITAQRRLHKGRSLCAFTPLVAPYLYCTAKAKEKSDDPPKPGGLYEKGADAAVAASKALKGAGVGTILLPFGPKTVLMRLTAWDIMLGAVELLLAKGAELVFSAGIARRLKPGRQVYQFTGRAAARRFMGGKMFKKAIEDLVVNNIVENVKAVFTDETFAAHAPFALGKLGPRGQMCVFAHETNVWRIQRVIKGDSSPSLRPIELLPEEEVGAPPPSESANTDSGDSAAEHDEMPGPYNPNQSPFPDYFLEGFPYAG